MIHFWIALPGIVICVACVAYTIIGELRSRRNAVVFRERMEMLFAEAEADWNEKYGRYLL